MIGWYDPKYGEIGNKCAWIQSGYQGAVSTITLKGQKYPVPSVWSNKNGGSCTTVA